MTYKNDFASANQYIQYVPKPNEPAEKICKMALQYDLETEEWTVECEKTPGDIVADPYGWVFAADSAVEGTVIAKNYVLWYGDDGYASASVVFIAPDETGLSVFTVTFDATTNEISVVAGALAFAE